MKLEKIIQAEYENVIQVDQQTIKVSKNVENIISIYRKYSSEMFQYPTRLKMKETFDEKITQELKKYTREDITATSFYFSSSEEKCSTDESLHRGIFLTELIQMHYEKIPSSEKYVLFMHSKKEYPSSINDQITNLCFKLNGPHIQIIGNGGNDICREMENGFVEVDDVSTYAGRSMNGGTLAIKGNALSYLGCKMQGGYILIEGNSYGTLGYEMKDGSILVKGSNDDFVGTDMQGGKITIMKDANNCGLHFSGGKIIVFGDVKIHTGNFMKGGEIIVKGNCHGDVGLEMTGGKISVKKIYDDYKNAIGGEIYQNGKRIFPEEK